MISPNQICIIPVRTSSRVDQHNLIKRRRNETLPLGTAVIVTILGLGIILTGLSAVLQ